MSKRKRIVLSVADKLKILDQLEKGINGSILAREYGVGNSTIYDIRKQSDSLKKFASTFFSENGSIHRKTMKTPQNKDLESALYNWWLQTRGEGQRVTGQLICEKALQLNKKFNGNPDFKATKGWLQRFKSRHGIRELDNQGEKDMQEKFSPCMSNSLVLSFSNVDECVKQNNKELLVKSEYETSDSLYNVEETRKPRKPLVPKRRTTVPDVKPELSCLAAMMYAKSSLQILTDEETSESIQIYNQGEENNAKKDPQVAVDEQDQCENKDSQENEIKENCQEKNIPTNDEAFHCLETAMRWLEHQKECDTVQLLTLIRLRDLAARKCLAG